MNILIYLLLQRQNLLPLRKEAFENIVENGENAGNSIFSFFHNIFYTIKLKSRHLSNYDFVVCKCFNLIPDMSILGFSNSAAKKDMMSRIWTNGDTII